MRRQVSSVLLCGAMMIAGCGMLVAQRASEGLPAVPKLEVAFTYNPTLAIDTTNQNFWMNGATVQLEGRFYKGLGIVADISRLTKRDINSSGVDMNLMTETFGPRYTFSPSHQKKYEIYGQALVGNTNGFGGVFPHVHGYTASAQSIAVLAGGGMNIRQSPRLSWRLFEADWLRTQLPNAGANSQNDFRLGFGLVYRAW
jgi:hypothetical protein